jgi:parvulin-like peptidyl-prolyl isomerase
MVRVLDFLRRNRGVTCRIGATPFRHSLSGDQGSGVRGENASPRHLEAGCGGPLCHEARRLSVPAAWLLCLLALAALTAACDRQEEGQEAVAWVNGEPILLSLFWDEIKNRYSEVAEASSPHQDVLLVLKKKVLNDLIRERLLLQEAARRGITVPDNVIEARVEEMKAGYVDSPLRRRLIEHGMDYDQWLRGLRESLVLEALFADVSLGAGKATDEEVSQYYKSHLDEFLIPETAQVSQIVVKSRSTAQRLLGEIRKGESFEALAVQYSIGPEREDAGSLGTYRRGELPEAMERAAFSTPVGKVSSLVETQHGFHLLKVVGRKPSHVQPEEEVRGEISRKLSQQKKQALYDQWVESLVRDSDIRVHASLAKWVTRGESMEPLSFKNEANRESE